MDTKTAARIEALKFSPGWDDLTRILTELEETFWKRHVRAVKRGEEIDQRKLDRALGHFDGIRDLLAAPEKAAAKMLREQQEDDVA